MKESGFGKTNALDRYLPVSKNLAPGFPYYYAWKNNEKRATMYMRRCRVLHRLSMNSCAIEFENGQTEIVSRNAIRRLICDYCHRRVVPRHFPLWDGLILLICPRCNIGTIDPKSKTKPKRKRSKRCP